MWGSVSREQEMRGDLYVGSKATASAGMLKLTNLPSVKGTYFEVTKLEDGSAPLRIVSHPGVGKQCTIDIMHTRKPTRIATQSKAI